MLLCNTKVKDVRKSPKMNYKILISVDLGSISNGPRTQAGLMKTIAPKLIESTGREATRGREAGGNNKEYFVDRHPMRRETPQAICRMNR